MLVVIVSRKLWLFKTYVSCTNIYVLVYQTTGYMDCNKWNTCKVLMRILSLDVLPATFCNVAMKEWGKKSVISLSQSR